MEKKPASKEEIIINNLKAKLVSLENKIKDYKEAEEAKEKKKSTKRKKLLSAIKYLAKKSENTTHEREIAEWMKAEDLLLTFIDDEDITKEFMKRMVFYP